MSIVGLKSSQLSMGLKHFVRNVDHLKFENPDKLGVNEDEERARKGLDKDAPTEPDKLNIVIL